MKKSKLSTAVEYSQLDIASIKESMVSSTLELSKQVLDAMETQDEDKMVELCEKCGTETVQAVVNELVEVGLLRVKK